MRSAHNSGRPIPQGRQPSLSDFQDWEKLKAMFSRTLELYERNDTSEALPLLRTIIRECHRLLTIFPNPSIIYTGVSSPVQSSTSYRSPQARQTELSTAFHATFGITLFFMGDILSQNPSLALRGEPGIASVYWIAALDVFETGESFMSDAHAENSGNVYEDWRMAIYWGRALVRLAGDKLSNPHAESIPGVDLTNMERSFPKDSPFYAIAVNRPPVARHMSFRSSSAHDFLLLAMDQFSRGIFHMPRSQSTHYRSPRISPNTSRSGNFAAFSRSKELFTIASEVLEVTEQLPNRENRQYWASWADSVFNQMSMEADIDAWRVTVSQARGRCHFIMGSARSEALEGTPARRTPAVLTSEIAEEAREDFTLAMTYLERAKGSPIMEPDEEIAALLVQSLIGLANLTIDPRRREELYTRAKLEGGDNIVIDRESHTPTQDGFRQRYNSGTPQVLARNVGQKRRRTASMAQDDPMSGNIWSSVS